MSNSTPWNSW